MRSRWLWAVVVLAALGAIGKGLKHSPTAALVQSELLAGESAKTVPLPDGSSVAVNANSELTLAFGGTQRHVRLDRGEAAFLVSRASDRPFAVNADGVVVRAPAGAAFNVGRLESGVNVLVTVGQVQVEAGGSGGDRLTLLVGQRAVLAPWMP